MYVFELEKKLNQKILFIRYHEPFIDALKDAGFEIKILHDLEADIAKTIRTERPELIIVFVDGLEYNGLDPLCYVPEKYLPLTLSVSSIISRSELLEETRKRLVYVESVVGRSNILPLKNDEK